jgi:hypothetical protein
MPGVAIVRNAVAALWSIRRGRCREGDRFRGRGTPGHPPGSATPTRAPQGGRGGSRVSSPAPLRAMLARHGMGARHGRIPLSCCCTPCGE